jgi:mycothiol synthase
MTFDELNLPCLYLLWPAGHLRVPPLPEMPHGYASRSYAEDDDVALRRLFEAEGWRLDEKEWQAYRDTILPGGMFLIFHAETGTAAATAGAVHNPRPGRYYFPFGGELGYLIVHPEHRGRRLGSAVSAMVVRRFISADYQSIRVCVQGFRLPAIKTYLKLGFLPFLHSEDVSPRWRRICASIDWPFEPEKWPRAG